MSKHHLELFYSKKDITVKWKDPAHREDMNLLFLYMCQPRNVFASTKQDPSLIEELESRGYDISTIKFSISKKEKL